MRPDEPMAAATCAVLEAVAKKASKKLRRARRGDPEGVHDARTSLRRLEEGLVVLGRVRCGDQATERAAVMHRVEKALGPTRDDDVFLADLDAWMRQSSDRAAAGLAPLRARLVERRKSHARKLGRALERSHARRHLERVRDWLGAGAREQPSRSRTRSGKQGRTLVRHYVHDQAWLTYEEIVAIDVRSFRDVDLIHKYRAACRRLRFLLEIFHGALHGEAEVIAALKALQERLGELHDHVVAARRIEKWLSARRVPATRSIRRYLEQRRSRRDRLQAEFGAEQHALGGPRFREALFRTLTDGRAPRTRLRLGAGSR